MISRLLEIVQGAYITSNVHASARMGTKFDFSAHFTHFSYFKNRQNFVISFSIILSNNNINKTTQPWLCGLWLYWSIIVLVL